MTRAKLALVLAPLIALLAIPARAEQFKAFGDIEVHYVVVNTMFLQDDVAARYGVIRGKDRAIVNLSVLGHDGTALSANVTGSTINLLDQHAQLQFSTTRDGDSIYFIAPLRYTDRDVLRFDLTVSVPGRAPMHLEFQQQMFYEPEP